MPPPNNTPEPFEASWEIYISAALEQPCFPAKVAQRYKDVYPRLTYTIVSGLPDLVLRGASGLSAKTLQVDIWSQSDLEACTLREQLRYAVQGFRGYMGSCRITNVLWSELPGAWEAGVDAQDKGTYRRSVEVKCWYREYVPGSDHAAPNTPGRGHSVGYDGGFFA